MSKKVDTYRRLRALMLELGHDQTSLGRRIGLSRQQISDRMICKTQWTLGEAYKVCDTLFIPVEEIRVFFPPNGVEEKKGKRRADKTPLDTMIKAAQTAIRGIGEEKQ